MAEEDEEDYEDYSMDQQETTGGNKEESVEVEDNVEEENQIVHDDKSLDSAMQGNAVNLNTESSKEMKKENHIGLFGKFNKESSS